MQSSISSFDCDNIFNLTEKVSSIIVILISATQAQSAKINLIGYVDRTSNNRLGKKL